MKITIFYAHPNKKGHSGAILAEVLKILEDKGADFEFYDLYASGYDPILKDEELYTMGNRQVSEENRKLQAMISASNRLIFIYPVWWGSMPAILKGFFDRIFVSGFAFRYINGIPHGLLKGKRADIFITTGANRFLTWLIGNRAKKLIKWDIMRFCGIKARVHQIGGCRELDEGKAREIKGRVRRALGWVVSNK